MLSAGSIIKSTAALNATYFENAIIYISEYNEKGALGFIINKIFERSLNELEEFRHSPAFPLYEGGPVDQQHLFFIHQRPDLIPDGKKIKDAIYLSGNFNEAVKYINNKTLKPDDIKIFTGYCGWNFGELEAEIKEGSWEISNNEETIFR